MMFSLKQLFEIVQKFIVFMIKQSFVKKIKREYNIKTAPQCQSNNKMIILFN